MFQRLLLLSVLFGLLLSASAQYTQNGKVREHNSGKQPLAGVAIEAYKASPTRTDNLGQFAINFPANTKRPGQRIVFREIEKTGFEVVNEKELEKAYLTEDKKDTLHVIMAPEGKIADARDEYYEISETSLERRYKHTKDSLKTALYQALLNQESFRKAIQEAEMKYQFASSQLDILAEKFARKNLDDVSDLYLKAFELFKKGEIFAALGILQQLGDEAKAFQDQYKKGEDLVMQGEKMKAEALAGLKRVAEGYVLEADLHLATFQIDKAQSAYQAAIICDSSNREILLEYAAFLLKQNQWDELPDIYDQALGASTNDLDSSEVFRLKGSLFTALNKVAEAQELLSNALEIQEDYYSTEPILTCSYLVQTYLAFSGLAQKQNSVSQAIDYLDHGIGINQVLEEHDLEQFQKHKALLLWEASGLNLELSLLEKAEIQLEEALQIYSSISEGDSSLRQATEASIQEDLAEVYRFKDAAQDEKRALRRAFSLRKALFERNPSAYQPVLAETYEVLGNFYNVHEQVDSAKIYYREALAMFEDLAEKNPLTYIPQLCIVLNDQGLFYRRRLETEKGIEYQHRALETLEPLYESSPNVHAPYMMRIYNALGVTFSSLNNKKEAETYLKKAINVFEKVLVEELQEPEAYIEEYGVLLGNISGLNVQTYDYDEAKIYINKAINWYEMYGHINPRKFRESIASLKFSEAFLEEEVGSIDVSIRLAKEAITTYRELVELDPAAYEKSLARALQDLSYFYYSGFIWWNKLPDISTLNEICEEGLQIWEKYPEAAYYEKGKKNLQFNIVFFKELPHSSLHSKVRKAEDFYFKAEAAYRQEDLNKAISHTEKAIRLCQTIHQADTSKSTWRWRLARNYSLLSKYCLLSRQYDTSLSAAEESRALTKSSTYLESLVNPAIIYVLKGNWSQSERYISTLSRSEPNLTRKEILILIDEVERYDITHPDFERLRALVHEIF